MLSLASTNTSTGFPSAANDVCAPARVYLSMTPLLLDSRVVPSDRAAMPPPAPDRQTDRYSDRTKAQRQRERERVCVLVSKKRRHHHHHQPQHQQQHHHSPRDGM